MRAHKLLKKMTSVKKITEIFITLSLAFTTNTAFAIDTSAGRPRTTQEIDREEAYACKDRLNLKVDDFSKACARAGLRGGTDSCKEQIELCDEFSDLDDEEKQESEYKHCFAATGETKALKERVERLEKKRDKAEENVEKSTKRIDELTEDYHTTTEEINTLADEQLQAKEEFDQLIAELANSKTEALNKTKDQIEGIDLKIYETQDAITSVYLEQQAMWTQNKLTCRAQANAAAQQVEQAAYAQKRSGKTYLSINGMLAKSGRSAKDEAIEMHNRVMRNCTSIRNPENTKDNTNFGDQILLKRSQDKQRISILKREIKRLGRRKKVATKFYQDSLDQMNRQEQNAFVAYFKKEAFLKNKGLQLRQKLTNIQYKLLLETQKLTQRQNNVREIEIELQKAEAKLTSASINGSSSDKESAFQEAVGLLDGLTERDAINVTCGLDTAIDASADARNAELDVDVDTTIDPATGEVTDVDVNIPQPEDASGGTTSGSDTVKCVKDENGGSGQRCEP